MIATIVSRLSDIPNLCASILRPGPLYQDPSRVVHQWVNQLEREAGVGDWPNSTTSESTLVTGIAGPGPSTISRRNRESISSRCSFPDFFLGSYEDALRTAQADAVALCVILLSNEHDDVGYFIQNTLIDGTFNRLLKDNGIVVWGGDVKDYEAYQASEKLSATTYPFVAFIALQPRSGSNNQRNNGSLHSGALTVLSRHEGPAWNDELNPGPTSTSTLCDHLSNHLLPRVKPFLERLRSTAQERRAQQLLRQQQDEAFALTAKLDREKMDAKLMAATQANDRKTRYQTQMAWYCYARRVLTSPEPDSPAGSIRISVKLQDGRRFIRLFKPTESLTCLYAFVASQLIPSDFDPSSDPSEPPARLPLLGETPWSFQLALSYPRREIRWEQDRPLSEIPELRGGQVVVEFTRNDIFDDGSGKNTPIGDDEYSTEEE